VRIDTLEMALNGRVAIRVIERTSRRRARGLFAPARETNSLASAEAPEGKLETTPLAPPPPFPYMRTRPAGVKMPAEA
jgi:hypothetical protein